MPPEVRQGINGIWITLGLCAIAALINKWTGEISFAHFAGTMIVYALFCIFPYKLSKGSNPARWIWIVLTVLEFLFMLAGDEAFKGMTKLDIYLSWFLIPVDLFVLYKLFQPNASAWFNRN